MKASTTRSSVILFGRNWFSIMLKRASPEAVTAASHRNYRYTGPPYIGVAGQPQSPARRVPIIQRANRLARRQARQQVGRTDSENRMAPLGWHLRQRNEHEPAFVHHRMPPHP